MVGLLEEGIVGHRSVGVWNITVAYYCRCANEWMLEVWSGLLSSRRCAVERIVGGCCAKRHAGDVCSMNLNFMCAVNDGLKISKFWFLKKSDPLLVIDPTIVIMMFSKHLCPSALTKQQHYRTIVR